MVAAMVAVPASAAAATVWAAEDSSAAAVISVAEISRAHRDLMAARFRVARGSVITVRATSVTGTAAGSTAIGMATGPVHAITTVTAAACASIRTARRTTTTTITTTATRRGTMAANTTGASGSRPAARSGAQDIITARAKPLHAAPPQLKHPAATPGVFLLEDMSSAPARRRRVGCAKQ